MKLEGWEPLNVLLSEAIVHFFQDERSDTLPCQCMRDVVLKFLLVHQLWLIYMKRAADGANYSLHLMLRFHSLGDGSPTALTASHGRNVYFYL